MSDESCRAGAHGLFRERIQMLFKYLFESEVYRITQKDEC